MHGADRRFATLRSDIVFQSLKRVTEEGGQWPPTALSIAEHAQLALQPEPDFEYFSHGSGGW
jgi:hypothetical protein